MTKTNKDVVYVIDTKGNLVVKPEKKEKRKVVPVIKGTKRWDTTGTIKRSLWKNTKS